MMSAKQAPVEKARIVLDQEWADSLDDARDVVRQARQAARVAGREVEGDDVDPAVVAAQIALQALVDAASVATVEFVFVGISRPAYQRLLDAHQATREQRKD